jgi:hypothetical protein
VLAVEPLAAHLDVVALVGADRDALVGDLGEVEQAGLEFVLEVGGPGLDLL